MREKVAEILEREVTRINELSKSIGLDLDEIRKLDLLIKAHKSFSAKDPAETPSDTESPRNQSNDDLVKDILSEPVESDN